MKAEYVVNLFLLSILVFVTACGKKNFETMHREPIITSGELDDVRLSEISSGGGISESEDDADDVQAEVTIGSVVTPASVAMGEVQTEVGFWNILGNIF